MNASKSSTRSLFHPSLSEQPNQLNLIHNSLLVEIFALLFSRRVLHTYKTSFLSLFSIAMKSMMNVKKWTRVDIAHSKIEWEEGNWLNFPMNTYLGKISQPCPMIEPIVSQIQLCWRWRKSKVMSSQEQRLSYSPCSKCSPTPLPLDCMDGQVPNHLVPF